MRRIGLLLSCIICVALAFLVGAAWVDAAQRMSRPLVVSHPSRLHHVRSHSALFAPIALVDPDRAYEPPVVNILILAAPGKPPDAATPQKTPPPPIQSKVIEVNPGSNRIWCWDQTTWSWVPTCP